MELGRLHERRQILREQHNPSQVSVPNHRSPSDTHTYSSSPFDSNVSQGPEAYGNFTNVHHTDPDELAFWLRLNETDEDIKGVGALCLETNGANLTYVGTAAAVRDMVSLSETLEGADTPVNYWGIRYGSSRIETYRLAEIVLISYGTVVGSFFLNSKSKFPMSYGVCLVSILVFPERAGRVILDGVVNPIHWTSEPQYQLWGCMRAPLNVCPYCIH